MPVGLDAGTIRKSDSHTQAVELACTLARQAEAEGDTKLFFWNDVNLLDVLFTPLYLACLRLSRQEKSCPRHWPRLRKTAYQLRIIIREQIAKRIAPMCRQAEILFWPSEPTHLSAMMPVANEPRLTDRHAFLVSDARTFFQLRNRQQPSFFADAIWSKKLKATLHEKRGQIGDGAVLRDWVSAVLATQSQNCDTYRQTLSNLLQANLPMAAKAAATAQISFKHIRPRTVVVGNDLTITGRAACLVARQLGVISVCPSHGRFNRDANRQHHVADHLAVYGESQRQSLISCGIAPERIKVVGAPYLDAIKPQTLQIHPEIATRLNIPAGAPWVLVALSGAGHLVSLSHHQQIIVNLFAACRQLSDVHFVVKLHRKDRTFHYRACPADIRERFHVVPNNTRGFPNTIFDWLQGPNALLTGASTVAIESMLMQVPVITMDFANELGDTDFIQQQATIHVQSPEQLVQAIKTIIANPDAYTATRDRAQQFVEREFYRLGGQASARAAELILSKIPKADDRSA